MLCWTCHEPVQGPVCVGCVAPQPPPTDLDPYELLGLPRRYSVTAEQVEQAYRALTRKLHPDRYAAKPAVWRRMALQWTASLNEARRILKDDDARAWYLATGSPRPRESGGPALDPAFLEEMFEWREREEAQPGVTRILAQERETQLRDELDTIFREWEAGRGTLHAVEDRLSRLRYVTGLGKEHGEHRD